MYTLIYKKKLAIIYATAFMFLASHILKDENDPRHLGLSQQLSDDSELAPSLLWSFLQNPSDRSTGVGGVLYTEDFHIPVWELKETYKENEVEFDCGNFLMVIITSSVAAHVQQREAIRKTWGRYPGKNYWNLFVLGKSHPDDKKLKEEIDKYRDIIQGDFIDSPENSTIKSMFAHRAVYDHCDFKFVVQTTDETYVNVAALMDNLQTIEQHATGRYVNLGLLSQEDTPVQRSGATVNVTTEQFPFEFFPRFTLGFGRILSHFTVEVLLRRYKYIIAFPVDDAYIGYVLARAGVHPCGPSYKSNSYFIPHPKHHTYACALNDIFMINAGTNFLNSSSRYYRDGVFAHRNCYQKEDHFKKMLGNCESERRRLAKSLTKTNISYRK